MPVSANAQALYLQLLNQFRSKFFPNELSIDNMQMHSLTRLSRQQLCNARTELQKLSLLKYAPGSGSASGIYQLIDISKLKLDSIIEISKQNEAEIADLTALKQKVDELAGEYRIWGNYVLQTLNEAIRTNSKGIYNNYYATTQTFLKAQNDLKYDIIYKLIQHLKFRQDISNKQAYILATIANEVKQNTFAKQHQMCLK